MKSSAPTLFLALLGAAGCTTSDVPTSEVPGSSLEFVTERVEMDDPRETIGVGGEGSIVVEASIVRGGHGHQLEASLNSGNELELVVRERIVSYGEDQTQMIYEGVVAVD